MGAALLAVGILLLATAGSALIVVLTPTSAPPASSSPLAAGRLPWEDMEHGTAMAYESSIDRLIMVGEMDQNVSAYTWLYDPTGQRWSLAFGAGVGLRWGHSIAPIFSGFAVLFGGFDNGPLGDTHYWDSSLQEWYAAGATNPPPARFRHAMAYDSQSARVVMFGGMTASGYSAETWSFDANTNSWTNRSPATSPAPRQFHSMAYDIARDRVVLYGGITTSGVSAETWEYDYDGNLWVNTTSGVNPGARYGAAAAYVVSSQRVVLFGGSPGSGFGTGTWAYDTATDSWVDRAPLSPPAKRYGHSMSHVASNGLLVAFGGQAANGRLHETWTYAYGTNTWNLVQQSPRPSPRMNHDMAFDTQNGRGIVFGGAIPSNNGETWAFRTSPFLWEKKSPATSPSPRADHAMVYDSQSDRVILFGGNALGPNGETWAYDYGTDTWTNMNPASPPSPRYDHAMSYDSTADRVVMFGGITAAGRNAETWTYDFNANSWLNRSPAGSPQGSSGHKLAYDSQSLSTVFFGGRVGAGVGTSYPEVWWYTHGSNFWYQGGYSHPSPFAGFSMTYHAAADRILLFGVLGGSRSIGAWEFNLQLGSFSQSAALRPPQTVQHGAVVYLPSDGLAYLFGGAKYELVAADETILDETWSYDRSADSWKYETPRLLPAGQSDHMFTYDVDSDRAVMFGGLGPSPETWLFDPGRNAWERVESAARPYGRADAAMAYDINSDRTLMFGGGGAVYDDTWLFDGDNRSWSLMTPITHPTQRSRSSLAYDSGSDRFVLYGGGNSGGTLFSETWMYHLDSNFWFDLQPVSPPTARNGAAMAYDMESDLVVMFGGRTFSSTVGETWTYDLEANQWALQSASNPPPARQGATMVYDVNSDRLLMFGGIDVGGFLLADTWSYDTNSAQWTELSPFLSPSARWFSGGAYDPLRGQLVIFGGDDEDGYRGDTWFFDASAATPVVPMEPTIASVFALVALPAVLMVLWGERSLGKLRALPRTKLL